MVIGKAQEGVSVIWDGKVGQLTDELTDARERRPPAAPRPHPRRPRKPGAGRRRGAPLPIDGGRGTTWIGAQLGVTKQAVDGFVKYKQRNAHADK